MDDYSDSHGGRYDASLASVLRTAVGFVLEALEQRRLEQATSLLTQLVGRGGGGERWSWLNSFCNTSGS